MVTKTICTKIFAISIITTTNSHERLVVVSDLLNVDVIFGVDVLLQSAIALCITVGADAAAQQAGRILQLTLILQASRGSASVAMTSL